MRVWYKSTLTVDGVADMFLVTPDDVRRPIQALIDSNYDGKVDIVVDDFNRDGLWDVSFYDTQHNGTITLVGFHPDGKIKASWYEKYDGSKIVRSIFRKSQLTLVRTSVMPTRTLQCVQGICRRLAQ